MGKGGRSEGEVLSVGHGLSLSLSSSQCWMRLMDWIWGVWQWEPQFLQCW